MTIFKNNNTLTPFKKYRELYELASSVNQDSIESIIISSYSIENNEVDSRCVNLKYLDDNKFIFFSNYNSPKSHQFASHPQVSAVIFWNKINIQIRLKANINKISSIYSDMHFKTRSKEKNALAISSDQSRPISSFLKFNNIYKLQLNANKDFKTRPSHWGGFEVEPYYFEFWTGHNNRLNHREAYYLDKNNEWSSSILQP